jgi:hypothetical protein
MEPVKLLNYQCGGNGAILKFYFCYSFLHGNIECKQQNAQDRNIKYNVFNKMYCIQRKTKIHKIQCIQCIEYNAYNLLLGANLRLFTQVSLKRKGLHSSFNFYSCLSHHPTWSFLYFYKVDFNMGISQ